MARLVYIVTVPVTADAFLRGQLKFMQERGFDVTVVSSPGPVAPLYTRMRVLAFPSMREGFPNVPLEAASAGVPAVGYRSTGVVDAIADGESGTIVAQNDVIGLANALEQYLANDDLYTLHAAQARARVLRSFARERMWEAWERLYRDSLNAKSPR